jgi:hypothetical protein
MYKVGLFQYKSQFDYVFNVNAGNQGSPIIFSQEMKIKLKNFDVEPREK